jgi:fluoride exporter
MRLLHCSNAFLSSYHAAVRRAGVRRNLRLPMVKGIGRLGTYGQAATYAWIALGGALGSMARFWVGIVVATYVGFRFPWGTLLINIIGSFIIGWFDALTGPSGHLAVPENARAFVMVGICGGFTTFSAFSLQILQLYQEGAALPASAYILASVALCLAAVWAGMLLGRA